MKPIQVLGLAGILASLAATGGSCNSVIAIGLSWVMLCANVYVFIEGGE